MAFEVLETLRHMEKVEFLAACERDEFTAKVSPSDACDGHERNHGGCTLRHALKLLFL